MNGLCPACIVEHYNKGLEFGDESYHRVVNKIPFELCEDHQKYDASCYFLADKIMNRDYTKFEAVYDSSKE